MISLYTDISSKCSFKLLHSLRACHDGNTISTTANTNTNTTIATGVLVGINTVIFDQPRLNVRDPLPDTYTIITDKNDNQPRPIIIDSNLKILDIDVNR